MNSGDPYSIPHTHTHHGFPGTAGSKAQAASKRVAPQKNFEVITPRNKPNMHSKKKELQKGAADTANKTLNRHPAMPSLTPKPPLPPSRGRVSGGHAHSAPSRKYHSPDSRSSPASFHTKESREPVVMATGTPRGAGPGGKAEAEEPQVGGKAQSSRLPHATTLREKGAKRETKERVLRCSAERVEIIETGLPCVLLAALPQNACHGRTGSPAPGRKWTRKGDRECACAAKATPPGSANVSDQGGPCD